MAVKKLEPSFHSKVWGATALQPWFPDSTEKTGEVWYHFAGSPLLVKFLFTTEKLSVQVHPDDAYAGAHENGSLGKTEMWYILRATPDAKIALGFKQEMTPEKLRESAQSGEIMELLNWIPAHAGDTFFVAPGTVHALGEGLALVEVQQFSDVTYRLYDYGRDRPLHLDQSMDVSHCGVYEQKPAPVGTIASCDLFKVEKHNWHGSFTYAARKSRFELLIVLEGTGTFAGARYQPGECWLIEAGTANFRVVADGDTKLLRAYVG